jgi:hypothetical protein
MWNLLLLISLFPIGIALAIRWWFGLRILMLHGNTSCRLAEERWQATLGLAPAIPGNEATALVAGQEIRRAALTAWQTADPKGAAARKSARTFGLAVPPLTAMVTVFAVILAKVPVMGAIAILLAATALATVMGLLSLGAELRVIGTTIGRIRNSRIFPRKDDEDAAVRCAIAHAWSDSLPPILRALQPLAIQVAKAKVRGR